ncbi:hypothetical protein L9F63_001171, partial [Diploptera punctata]
GWCGDIILSRVSSSTDPLARGYSRKPENIALTDYAEQRREYKRLLKEKKTAYDLDLEQILIAETEIKPYNILRTSKKRHPTPLPGPSGTFILQLVTPTWNAYKTTANTVTTESGITTATTDKSRYGFYSTIPPTPLIIGRSQSGSNNLLRQLWLQRFPLQSRYTGRYDSGSNTMQYNPDPTT